MNKNKIYGELWAGTENSFSQYAQANESIQAAMLEGRIPPPAGGLLEVVGNVGIISIKGPMTNTRSVFDDLFGVVSYPAIQEGLLEALQDPKITSVVLDIDSGGGAVNGVQDVANLISYLDEVKPVYAYTGGSMSSAAYWLGSSARAVYSAETATSGSIGVIVTHVERSRQLEAEGLKATVIRSGKYKGLGNSVESLTEEAKAEIQTQVDATNRIFVSHVAQARNKSYDYTDNHMGQGRVFMAQTALELGLIDGIKSFDELLLEISTNTVDKNKKSLENNGIGANTMNNKNKPTLLSAAVQAALVASGQIPSVQGVATEGDATLPTDSTTQLAGEAGVATTATDSPLQGEVGTLEVEATNTIDKIGKPSEDYEALTSEVVDLKAELKVLKGQLSEQTTALVLAQASSSSYQEKLAASEQTNTALAAIVAKSVNAMTVALGGSARNLDACTPAEILTLHSQTAADFQTKFKAGGVAVATPADATRQNVESRTAMDMARIKATSL